MTKIEQPSTEVGPGGDGGPRHGQHHTTRWWIAGLVAVVAVVSRRSSTAPEATTVPPLARTTWPASGSI